jgi:outer membrane protein assembly factor BamB
MFTHARKILLLFAFLALLASCSTHSLTDTPNTQQGKFSTIPTGKGNQPEQGTDGKPKPLPNGHWESILVANGIAYVGSDNEELYAFDEHSGRILWQHKQSANSLNALVEGIIISTDQTRDNVYGLDATNGVLLWRHATPDIDHVQTMNGIVYVDTGDSAHTAFIYAFQSRSGVLLWQHAQGPDGLGTVRVINGRVYDAPLAEASGGSTKPQIITVLDASSGGVLWQITIPKQDGVVRNGIVEANGVAYIGTNHGSVYALQPQMGQIIWHISQSASSFADQDITLVTPVVSDGIVFAGSVEHVFAYRASDGKQLWEYSVHTDGGPSFGMQPFVNNGVVYFVSSFASGKLVALRANEGTLIWQTQQGAIDPSDLMLANGLLVNLVGTLTAWRASDGTQIWQRATDNDAGPPGPGRPVVVGDGAIYVGGDDGVLHAFQLSDGTQLWQYKIPELPMQEPPVYTAFITFSKTTTYDQAIQTVSDLGLKTSVLCQATWAPEDGKQCYPRDHVLGVTATPNSAPLWLERLQATPGVTQAQVLQGPYHCPAEHITPNQLQFLPESQVGTYLQVSFASDTAYLNAWESLNALGFRLADPCYEKARAQGNRPTWHPMGEEDSFAQTHTFVLATDLNATIWRQQLQSVAGIGKIQVLTGGAACNS